MPFSARDDRAAGSNRVQARTGEAMSMFDKIKSAAGTAAGAVAGAAGAAAGAVAGVAGDLLGAGIDTLKGWVDDIAAASPHLKAVGYEVADLKLELSLSPRVIVELVREAEAGDEAFQAVLANHPDNKTLRTLVRMVQQANRVDRRVRPQGRRFRSLEVELGLPPVARMRYVDCPEESRSADSPAPAEVAAPPGQAPAGPEQPPGTAPPP
jgi:hypothetical protein